MNVNAASAELLKRPDLPLVLERVQAQLADEATRRHAFREWLDEDKKAEFINGEIILHSPVKRRHLGVSNKLASLLIVFTRLRKLGEVMIEKAVIGLTRNDYEPAIAFFTLERANTFTDDQMIFPAPDFVVEILSRATAKNDRGIKRVDYAAHGVYEYWIIDPEKQTIEQFIRVGNDTEFMPPSKFTMDNTIASAVIAGFEIPVAAIFDEAICAQVLQQIVDPQ